MSGTVTERPAEKCWECEVDTLDMSVTPCEKHRGVSGLERAVIEAAIKFREAKDADYHFEAEQDFNEAVDALLKSRQK